MRQRTVALLQMLPGQPAVHRLRMAHTSCLSVQANAALTAALLQMLPGERHQQQLLCAHSCKIMSTARTSHGQPSALFHLQPIAGR